MAAKDQDGKITHRRANMRDVAKLAGVSTATVSYVINQRPDQHISEATKKKVLQAINYLNYSPNPYASELNMLRTNTILLRTSKHVSWLQGMETLCFHARLSALFAKQTTSCSPIRKISATCACPPPPACA